MTAVTAIAKPPEPAENFERGESLEFWDLSPSGVPPVFPKTPRASGEVSYEPSALPLARTGS